MLSTRKRIGYFFFCLVPLCIVGLLQFLLSIPAVAITGIWTLLHDFTHEASFQELLEKLTQNLSGSSFTVGLSAAYALVALLIFGFWYLKRFAATEETILGSRSSSNLLSDALNPSIVGALALLAIGGQYVTTYLMTIIAALFPSWMAQYEALLQSIDVEQPSLLLILYSCIIAPLSEECIFRGVTYSYAKKALPVAGAICYQSVLFGVFHMNPIQGIYVALFGLLLGYVKEYGGSILYPMLLHFFFNFIGTLLNNYLFYNMEQPFFFLLFLTIGVLATFAGIFLFQYGIWQRDVMQDVSQKERS